MGFFANLFGRKSPLEKHAERAGNKRAQNADRWESIQELGKMGTDPDAALEDRAAAVSALLERFTFYVDPSITDGEEKDEAFRWVCEAGSAAIGPVRKALREQESLSWLLKILGHLVDDDGVTAEMVKLLGTMDTEYARDPQRKLQLLSSLEARRHADIAAAVVPFFADVNEEARFHAIATALAQENAADVLSEVHEALVEEESVRVKVRAFEALAKHGWDLGDRKDDIELPEGWTLDGSGVPKRAPRKAAPKKVAPATAAPDAARPASPAGSARSGTKSKKRRRR